MRDLGRAKRATIAATKWSDQLELLWGITDAEWQGGLWKLVKPNSTSWGWSTVEADFYLGFDGLARSAELRYEPPTALDGQRQRRGD